MSEDSFSMEHLEEAGQAIGAAVGFSKVSSGKSSNVLPFEVTLSTLCRMWTSNKVLSYSKAFSVSAQKLTNPEWNPTNIFKIKEYTGTQEKIEINKMISTKKCPFSCLFHSRFEKNCQVSLLNITIQRSQKMKIWIQKTLLSFFSLASMVFEVS